MDKKKTKARQPARSVYVGGSVSAPFVVGDGNTVIDGDGNTVINTDIFNGPPVTTEELSQWRQTIEALKAQVAAQAPPEKQAAAVERLDELHQAITVDKPEVSTMKYVRDWFVKNIPTMAGAVTAVIINPIVGSLVKAGGDVLVAEFKSQFGI